MKDSHKISQSISNVGFISGGIQAAIGDNIQNMTTVSDQENNTFSSTEMIKLLSQIEKVIKNTDFPPEAEEMKRKIEHYVTQSKMEAEIKNPDKQFIRTKLEQVSTDIEKASKTFDSVSNLWRKVKPLCLKLLGLLSNMV
ncbi:hypothetical protein cce_1939 [Crocosphaera subtropica ATCC 51142]|uniref:Uncharacterized protein n=1 Tax=Crocosphaera subtropica (strain ATCC 51142 / BH68) TaxID=43989 RepID=B1X0K0_CROS5|nr:hypothetical protein [Crocosphaera subtropica]ACB51289.1 hypothetical protein cce_1939 [Crocosphaera subtropica ATCC 51142]